MKLLQKINKYNPFSIDGKINIIEKRIKKTEKYSETLKETSELINDFTKKFNVRCDELIKKLNENESLEVKIEHENHADESLNENDTLSNHESFKEIFEKMDNSEEDKKEREKNIYIKNFLSKKFKSAYSAIIPLENAHSVRNFLSEENLEWEENTKDNIIYSKDGLFSIEFNGPLDNDSSLISVATINTKLTFVPHKSQKDLLKSFINDFNLCEIECGSLGIPGVGAIVETEYDDVAGINLSIENKNLSLTIVYDDEIENKYAEYLISSSINNVSEEECTK